MNRITKGRALLGSIGGTVTLPSSHRFYGDMNVQVASTDATRGGIKLGGMTMYIKKIPLAANAVNTGTTSVYDTSWDLPARSIVEDVWLQTITAATSATDTLSVGLTSSANGFLNAVEPTSAFTPKTHQYGALLKLQTTTFSQRRPYYTASATSVSVIVSRSATVFSATWAGSLYIKYYMPTS